MNQTRAEEITMREDYGNINLETGKKKHVQYSTGTGSRKSNFFLRSRIQTFLGGFTI